MKKSLLFVLSAIALILITSTRAYSVKHIVNVQNYAFVPANLSVQVGDTIRWVWINGSHTTTSTTIPTGAPAWDHPINSTNTFYEYRVNVAGVYDYLCIPHQNTQIGHFTATNPTPTLAVTPSNQNVSASAGSTNFSVTSNSNWTASSNQGWCTVTSSGSGNGTIVANYTANTVTSQRVATITVTVSGLPSTTVTVTQAAASPTLTVTPSNQNVGYQAGSTNFTVTSNSAWTASSNMGWCTVTPSGNGNGAITATYTENTLTTQRVATITVMVSGAPNQTVTVTQAGFAATLSVTPSNQNVGYQAGSTNFTVTSNSAWTASSNMGWCTVTPSGNGNGAITATYTENTLTTQRVATITVTVSGLPSQTVTVTQAAFAVALTVTPSNQNVSSEAGTTNFSVLSNSNWTVASNATWITVPSSGSGNASLTVAYDANLEITQRVATITVTAQGAPPVQVTVTQAGAATILVVDPLNQDVTYQAGSTSFTITSNAPWSVTSAESWVSSTADGNGNGVILVDYDENTSNEVRVATLSVSAPNAVQLITVTQEGFVSVIDNPLTGVKVFPNPSSGIVEVTSDITGLSSMKVMDLKGNVIFEKEITNLRSYQLDLSSIAKGTYLFRLDNDGKSFVSRIVLIK